MYKIFLSNLDYDTSQEELSSAIREYCSDCTVDLPRDRRTGKGRGFAFLEAPTEEKGKYLMDKIRTLKVSGRLVAAKEYSDNSRPKMPRRDEVYNER